MALALRVPINTNPCGRVPSEARPALAGASDLALRCPACVHHSTRSPDGTRHPSVDPGLLPGREFQASPDRPGRSTPQCERGEFRQQSRTSLLSYGPIRTWRSPFRKSGRFRTRMSAVAAACPNDCHAPGPPHDGRGWRAECSRAGRQGKTGAITGNRPKRLGYRDESLSRATCTEGCRVVTRR